MGIIALILATTMVWCFTPAMAAPRRAPAPQRPDWTGNRTANFSAWKTANGTDSFIPPFARSVSVSALSAAATSSSSAGSVTDLSAFKPTASTLATSGSAMSAIEPTVTAGPGSGADIAANSNAGVGIASVHNKCGFSVRSNFVHGARAGDEQRPEEIASVLAPGQSLSHGLSEDPNLGMSWKISHVDGDNLNPIQLEYTWVTNVKRVWWDLSMIDAGAATWVETPEDANGAAPSELVEDQDGLGEYVGNIGILHSFAKYGMTLMPHVAGKEVAEGNCAAVKCASGQDVCTSAYNVWNDWGQQKDCAEGVSLTLTLCG